MNTYIYIKNDGIQVVTPKNKQFHCQELPLEQGAILNGVIINPNLIQAALRTLIPAPKKVTLVLDSSNIMSKRLQLPPVQNNRLHQIVKGEFDLFQKEDQYLFDANVLSQGSAMEVMAYAVSRDLLDSYLSLFQSLSIRVTRVDVAINGIIKYIASKPTHAQETFLLNTIVGNTMLSLLFENGVYKLTNRVRLLQTGMGELYYQELYSRLSSMVQFSQSEKSQFPLEKSYYIGLSDQDIQGLMNFVHGLTPVEVLPYRDESMDMDYFYPMTATLANKRDVNLAIDKEHRAQKKSLHLSRFSRVCICLLVATLVGGHAYYLLQQRDAATAQQATLQSYVTDTQVQSQLAYFNELETANSGVTAQVNCLQGVLDFAQEENPMERALLQQIYDGDMVSSFSYQYDGGLVTIESKHVDYAVGIDYAAALRKADFFDTMNYTGHSWDIYEDYSEYSFHIDAAVDTLSGGEGG